MLIIRMLLVNNLIQHLQYNQWIANNPLILID